MSMIMNMAMHMIMIMSMINQHNNYLVMTVHVLMTIKTSTIKPARS